MPFWNNRKPAYLTNATRRHVAQTFHRLRWMRLTNPEQSAALERAQVLVPGSLVVAAWALQDALMSITRDEAFGPIDDTIIDRWTHMDLDGIRAHLAGELQAYTSYRLTERDFSKEQAA